MSNLHGMSDAERQALLSNLSAKSGGMRPEVVALREEVFANGKKVFDCDGSKILGEIEVYAKSVVDGKPIITKGYIHNDLLVTGAVFATEKFHNVRSNFQTMPLDLELGVHSLDQIVRDNSTLPSEHICGLTIGTGGAGDTYNTVYKVTRTDRHVPNMIPFRVRPIDSDLTGATRAQYFLRVVRGDYVYYYGKKFDVDRDIYVEYEDGTTVPLDADKVPSNKFVRVYSRMRVTVDQYDVREYAKYTYGSTLRSLVNSIGLITGYEGKSDDGQQEFFNVRGMTIANMENQELKDSESTITFVYKQYVV